jgi:hypothetical protein
LLACGVGLDSSVGLIVATLDLQLVRLLRAAMRHGEVGPGDDMRLIHPEPVIRPRHRAGPEPIIEPRPHVRPEPMFEPREKLRADGIPVACCDSIAPFTCAEPVEKASPSSSPIEPPWKVLPWEDRPIPAPRPPRKIKVIVTRPDSYCKGSVIDLFI